MTKLKFYINSDNISGNAKNHNSKNPDVRYCKQVVKEIKKLGYEAHYMGVGPGVKDHPATYGATGKNKVNVHIVGGLCAGTMKWLSSSGFQKIMKGGYTVFALRLWGSTLYKRNFSKKKKKIRPDFEKLSWLPRAWDDGFSGAFKGLSHPARVLRNGKSGYCYDTTPKGVHKNSLESSAKQLALNLTSNQTGAVDKKHKNYTIRDDWEGTEVYSKTTGKDSETWGYNCDTPFRGYIYVKFRVVPTNKDISPFKKTAYIDFTTEAPDLPYAGYSFSAENPVLVNNEFRELRLNLFERIDKVMGSRKGTYYVTEIGLIDTIPAAETSSDSKRLYEKTNHSDYKLLIRECGFSNYEEISSKNLGFSGKTLLDGVKECLDETEYLYKIKYDDSNNRYDDKIEFYKDTDYDNPYATYTQGSNGTIIGVSDISYAPLSTLRNNSIVMFKSKADSDDEENISQMYTQSTLNNSIGEYREFTTIQQISGTISEREAYYEALKKEDYMRWPETSYTITVAGYDGVKPMDWVRTIMNRTYLNDVKRVSSVEINGSTSQTPQVRTTLGLGAMTKKMRAQAKLIKSRRDAKKLVIKEPIKHGIRGVTLGDELW